MAPRTIKQHRTEVADDRGRERSHHEQPIDVGGTGLGLLGQQHVRSFAQRVDAVYPVVARSTTSRPCPKSRGLLRADSQTSVPWGRSISGAATPATRMPVGISTVRRIWPTIEGSRPNIVVQMR